MKKIFYLFVLLTIFACDELSQSQSTPTLRIDQTMEIVGEEGGEFVVEVTANVEWIATEDCDWLTLSQTEGDGDATVTVSVEPNYTIQDGQVNVVFSGEGVESKTLIVCRDAASEVPDPYVTIDTNEYECDNNGGELVVNVTSNVQWSASCDSDWVTVSPTEGIVEGEVTITIDPTESINSSGAKVVFAAEGASSTKTLFITRRGGEPGADAVYRRRSLITKFTGTWCGYCPNMTYALEDLIESDPYSFVEIAMHYGDNLSTNYVVTYANAFGVEGFPTIVVDMNGSYMTYNSSSSYIKNYITKSQDGNPTVAALEASVTVDEDNLVNVDVESTVTEAGNYKIICAYTVGGFTETQSGASAGYEQNHVLQSFLQSDVWGDELKAGGCAAGDVVETNYTMTIDSEYIDRANFVIVILNEQEDGSYYVNNAIECAVGEKKYYEYEE